MRRSVNFDRIPYELREDARQEAALAELEGRDQVAAVWAFVKREQRYQDRFGHRLPKNICAAVMALALLVPGCTSATKSIDAGARRIAAAAADIESAAASSTQRFEEVSQLGGPFAELAEGGIAEQRLIQDRALDVAGTASKVRTELTGVVDRTPWWAGLIRLVATAAIGGAVVVLAFYAWRVVGPVVGLIPRRSNSLGTLAAKVESGRLPATTLVTALREDRAVDTAYRRVG